MITSAVPTTNTEVHMFFIFIMTAALGGWLFGSGIREGDPGIVVLGAIIAVTSIIATGYVGVPA